MKKHKGATIKSRFTYMSLNNKLRVLLLVIFLPLIAVIVFTLLSLRSFTNQYSTILLNVMTASEFNLEFKESLDYNMYCYIANSNINVLPMEEVEHAEEVAKRLQNTTTIEDNKSRIKDILCLCAKLREKMKSIEASDSYDDRIDQLEYINITTSLIESGFHEYIYYEIRYLTELQGAANKEANYVIVGSVISVGVLLIILSILSVRFTTSITKPIKELSENVYRVGTGDFSVQSVTGHDNEIQALSIGFDRMVTRIDTLVEHIKEEQDSLRRTELQLLQAQINPHFLYNTLDTIIWFAETEQSEQVVHMVESLSAFFRASLSKGQDVVTVKTEECHVCSYLQIQQMRYGDILDYEIVIDEEIKDCLIPKITLQPLVENAIYHGIKNKRGKGKVIVTGKKKAQDLYFTVMDNGAGMTEERLEKLRSELKGERKQGFGICNVNERIQLYYGEKYGLAIDSKFGEGTSVIIRAPIRK